MQQRQTRHSSSSRDGTIAQPLLLTCSPSSRAQIESYVYDVVRSTVPKIELDDVFLTKEEIASSISEALKESMASFGYQILGTPITDIDPDREVKRAMNEINKMKRLRVAAEDEGEAVKIRAVKELPMRSCASQPTHQHIGLMARRRLL